MQRVGDPPGAMAWLGGGPNEWVTGFDAEGWPASTWVLHAMYENPDLMGLGTQEDRGRHLLDSDDSAPLVVGGIDLKSDPTLTQGHRGFEVRPDHRWRRVTWAEYLARSPELSDHHEYPPSIRWFPHERWPEDWPVALVPPTEGSLDQVCLKALVSALGRHSTYREQTRCYAFYASIPAEDENHVHLWEGQLGHIPELIADNGGPYDFSPSNIWPAGRDWFVYTDEDLLATRVSGPEALIDDLRSDPELECIDWQRPRS